MLISRKSLWLGLIISAFILGLFTLPPTALFNETLSTLTDPSIVLLSVAVGSIAILGGVMERGGLLDNLVSNLRMSKKMFLAFAPALLSLLPIPGGALLSAPLVRKGGDGVSSERKAAINVWYRHTFILIYPLGALLVTTEMAHLNLYATVPYVAPGFLFMLLGGYFFLLKDIPGRIGDRNPPIVSKIIIPVGIVLLAPTIHFSLMTLLPNIIPEIPLMIGIISSLALSCYFGDLHWKDCRPVLSNMKPWNFALLIIGMFLLLNIFQASGAPGVIASVAISQAFLLVIISAFLGFAIGRIQVPVSIILPIYYVKYGAIISPTAFAIMLCSAMMGYVISPVHPCIAISLEFFNVKFKDFLKPLRALVAIGTGLAFIAASVLC